MSISTNVIQRVSVNAQHCPAGLVIFVFFTNFNISSLNIGFPIHTSEPKRPKIITFWKQLGMLISIFLHKVELWLKLIVPIQTFSCFIASYLFSPHWFANGCHVHFSLPIFFWKFDPVVYFFCKFDLVVHFSENS